MVVKILKKGNRIETTPVVPSVASMRVVIKKKGLRQPSMMALQATKNLVENGGKKGLALKDAGFSKAVQKTPGKVFGQEGVQAVLDPVVKQLHGIRGKMLKSLEKKDFNKQSPYNLTVMASIITKDAELLAGKPTDRTVYELPLDEQEKLKKLLEKNKKK